ncbi:MAG: ankyrin repeat domain-containing protein [Alphaproteobacteria bacterium]
MEPETTDVSDKWEDAREVFFRAIKKENTALLDAVVKKYPEALEWQTDPGTSLFIALNAGKITSFKHLVDLGADVNGINGNGVGILLLAARCGTKDFVEFLLERGATVDKRYVSEATRFDHHQVADLLKRADKIRAAWLAKNPPPAPPADPNVTTDEKVTVMNPLQLKQPTITSPL